MNKAMRYRVNAGICALVLAHAVYLFTSDRLEAATDFRIGLAVAQGVLGLLGAVWFWNRSRTFSE
jgi:hypothetical protein